MQCLFQILSNYFPKINLAELTVFFNQLIPKLSLKELDFKFNFLPHIAFISDSTLQAEMLKKRNNQYTKQNVAPKWLNYAWDIVATIQNCRKNFIFSRYNDDSKEKSNKPKIGLENIEENLKERIYNTFSDFETEISQMFASSEEFWRRANSKYSLLNFMGRL